MVRRTVRIVDLDRIETEHLGQHASGSQSTSRGARDGPARARERRTLVRHRHQRMEAEGLMRSENVEAGRSRAVADKRSQLDRCSSRGDLGVGHRENDDVVSHPVEAATERTPDPRQRRNQRPAEAARTDHGTAAGKRHIIPRSGRVTGCL